MLSAKIRSILFKNKKTLPILLMFLFAVLFFSTRLPRLANDVINPDGVLWHNRSEQFIVGIKHRQFEKTFQHYQPGVTLMWIVGISTELFKQITNITVYNSETYVRFDFVAKLTLIMIQLILSILIIFYLSKITGILKAILIVAIFTLEPFLIGNSRILHMDVLSTLLVFMCLILVYDNINQPTFLKSLFIGLLISLSFLTKSLFIGVLFYVIFYLLFNAFVFKNDKKEIIKSLIYILLSFLFFTLLLFPALWKNPWYYLFEMTFREGQIAGMVEGHKQIVFGKQVMNGGVAFYFLVLLIKMSPFTLVGLFIFMFYKFKFFEVNSKIREYFKNKKIDFGLFISMFYLGYIVFMVIASKKIDRYIVFTYPVFAYLAYSGYEYVLNRFKNKSTGILLTLFIFIVFVLLPIIKVFPWYFTYTSPIFGSTSFANRIIGQKSFGVGIPDLKKYILENYEVEPVIGFYDTQPMRAIYPNSKVFDVRVYGPSNYDILILGINEEMPEKVISNKEYLFEKSHSIWINGLEYWRIYNKVSVGKNNNEK